MVEGEKNEEKAYSMAKTATQIKRNDLKMEAADLYPSDGTAMLQHNVAALLQKKIFFSHF